MPPTSSSAGRPACPVPAPDARLGGRHTSDWSHVLPAPLPSWEVTLPLSRVLVCALFTSCRAEVVAEGRSHTGLPCGWDPLQGLGGRGGRAGARGRGQGAAVSARCLRASCSEQLPRDRALLSGVSAGALGLLEEAQMRTQLVQVHVGRTVHG